MGLEANEWYIKRMNKHMKKEDYRGTGRKLKGVLAG